MTRDTMPQQELTVLRCVALYDNIAEAPDELAFRRGDVLTVLERDAAGLSGWWLCSLRGRQGICPANRLRVVSGSSLSANSTTNSTTNLTANSTTNLTANSTTNLTASTTSAALGKRRSWHVQPNRVMTPQRFGDVYLYDLPPNRNSSDSSQGRYSSPRNATPDSLCGESYDVPPRAVPCIQPANMCYDTPSPQPRLVGVGPQRDSGEAYDVPRPLGSKSPISCGGNGGGMSTLQLTPSSSASSLTADSVASSNRSSLASCANEYDVPRKTLGLAMPQHVLAAQMYDVPSPNPSPREPRELPLELSSALETLANLESEATLAVSRLLGFAGPQWRQREKLESRIMDIKLAVVRLRTSVHNLAEFGEGTLGNAARAADKMLANKLRPLVKALRDADRLIQETTSALDSLDWSVDALSRDDDARRSHSDALDQLVACARALSDDVRQATSTIQGNATLLFKRTVSPSCSHNSGEWHEDYDYVKLQSKDSVSKQNSEIREQLPDKMKKSFDALVQQAESVVLADDKRPTGEADDDYRVLNFYSGQAVTHSCHLTHAIDAFLQTVEHNQPPKVFLAHGKFVVLSAHCLVQVGDTVHRNVAKAQVRTRVLNCTNALSEGLATTVSKIKKAALQFPSVTAVQEMVDSVVDISHLARDLKLSLVQATQMTNL